MVCAGLLVLGGCADQEGTPLGEVGYVAGFFGGVAAEEPNAALIGRDILTSGGTAADAAVAMGFALSVTLPSSASLGGGGSCIVHDASLGITEVVNFIPTAGSGSGGDRPSAVPALARGLVAMHARYGRLDWRRVVSPAELLARLGHRVSRAFARELARAAKPLFADPETRRIFADDSGRPLAEGDLLVQPDLAGVLGRIRGGGAGVFYNGPFARAMVEAFNQAGGRLALEDLINYRPQLEQTLIMAYRDDEVHFAPPPAAAGIVQAQIWRMLSESDRYANAPPEERPHMLAEAMKRALADRKRWLAEGFLSTEPPQDLVAPEHTEAQFANYNPNAPTDGAQLDPAARQLFEVISGTGFVVVDREGGAVACNLTLFNRFGTGRMAPGTGIVLGAAPLGRGRNPLGLSPMMVVNRNTFAFKYAIAAGGGPLAQAALSKITAETLLAGEPLGRAIGAPRFLSLDVPTLILVEKTGAGAALGEVLAARGHEVKETEWLGQAAAVHCPNGLPATEEKQVCRVAHDPRGAGLSAVAE